MDEREAQATRHAAKIAANMKALSENGLPWKVKARILRAALKEEGDPQEEVLAWGAAGGLGDDGDTPSQETEQVSPT